MLKQLYPSCAEPSLLKGIYLKLNLHQRAKAGDVFIYANYISSLDGRISLFDKKEDEYTVPPSIANARDWRLYQELAGQSDMMLTSARYFRQLAKGKAQDLLPVGLSPNFEDIKQWREQQGLKAQPDVLILSDSLDIPLAALRSLSDRKTIVLTKTQANQDKVQQLETCGVQVIQAATAVTGQFVRQSLIALGYQSAYMIAGPKVHHTLLVDGCVDELFLTSHFSLLGGQAFHSILEDDMPVNHMKLLSLYLDEQEGQMFQRFAYQQIAYQNKGK